MYCGQIMIAKLITFTILCSYSINKAFSFQCYTCSTEVNADCATGSVNEDYLVTCTNEEEAVTDLTSTSTTLKTTTSTTPPSTISTPTTPPPTITTPSTPPTTIATPTTPPSTITTPSTPPATITTPTITTPPTPPTTITTPTTLPPSTPPPTTTSSSSSTPNETETPESTSNETETPESTPNETETSESITQSNLKDESGRHNVHYRVSRVRRSSSISLLDETQNDKWQCYKVIFKPKDRESVTKRGCVRINQTCNDIVENSNIVNGESDGCHLCDSEKCNSSSNISISLWSLISSLSFILVLRINGLQ